MNTTRREKTIKELFLGELWIHLRDNYHKYSEANQIKIALALLSKDIPQKFEGDVKVTEMPAIQKEFSVDSPTQNRITEFLIGSLDSSKDS